MEEYKITLETSSLKELENLVGTNEWTIELYIGNYWNKSSNDKLLADFNKTKTIKTLSNYLEFWKEEILQNENIKHNVNIQSGFKQLISSINNNDTHNFQYYLGEFPNIINNNNFCLSESTLYSLMKKEGVFSKSSEYQIGFLRYFYTNNNQGVLNNQERIDGFQHIVELKSDRKKDEAWSEIGETISNYQKDYKKFNLKLKELEAWREIQLNKIEEKKLTLSNTSNEAIEKLNKEKEKLMLSGPLKMWHDRLSIYEGGRYINQEGKNFNFIHIKHKDLVKLDEKTLKNKYRVNRPITNEDKALSKKGKTQIDKTWAISFGILGMLATLFFISLPLIIFKNIIWDDNHKLIILVSLLGSFGLFIYGYLLRIFVKNWNSSRHISEEIQERISLTQFYLTLLQDENIEPSHAQFALKEIFRRINTGLIKDHDNDKNVLEILKTISSNK